MDEERKWTSINVMNVGILAMKILLENAKLPVKSAVAMAGYDVQSVMNV